MRETRADSPPKRPPDCPDPTFSGALKSVLGKAMKHPSNPLVVEDRPWEVRTDNMYPNVIYDQEEHIFKLWYTPFVSFPEIRECALCYATSVDGIHWEKPELDICGYRGVTRTNILSRLVHGAGVVKDPRESDPSKRYKMLYLVPADLVGYGPSDILANLEPGRPVPRCPGLYVAFSSDGVHWRHPERNPIATVEEGGHIGDTHNNFLWDPALGRYVAMTRLWENGVRVVGRMTSPDFMDWSKPEVVLRPAHNEAPVRQLYSMATSLCYGRYLGLLSVFNSDPEQDTLDLEVAWSNDGIHWHRVCPGKPLIRRGAPGSFDSHCVFGAPTPIIRDGELWIYYAGCDGRHGGPRRSGLGLARLHMNGLCVL